MQAKHIVTRRRYLKLKWKLVNIFYHMSKANTCDLLLCRIVQNLKIAMKKKQVMGTTQLGKTSEVLAEKLERGLFRQINIGVYRKRGNFFFFLHYMSMGVTYEVI